MQICGRLRDRDRVRVYVCVSVRARARQQIAAARGVCRGDLMEIVSPPAKVVKNDTAHGLYTAKYYNNIITHLIIKYAYV